MEKTPTAANGMVTPKTALAKPQPKQFHARISPYSPSPESVDAKQSVSITPKSAAKRKDTRTVRPSKAGKKSRSIGKKLQETATAESTCDTTSISLTPPK